MLLGILSEEERTVAERNYEFIITMTEEEILLLAYNNLSATLLKNDFELIRLQLEGLHQMEVLRALGMPLSTLESLVAVP